jgi:RNA polymerase sigma factor (sigma-70 family)
VTSASPESSDGRVGVRAALSKAALRLQSDRRLVAMTRDGSGLAFGVIMERYRAPLLAYCRRLLGPDEAEDAFQQTLVNALGALRRDDRDIDLRPWLYRIAHNVAINALTRSGRHYEELDNQYDGVPQPPDILDEKLRVERLVKEICDLPERQRVAVVAHELEGRSYEEIARRMDATTPVVRQLIYRARSRLRDACGVLVPAGALRWLVFADLRTAGSERAGEAVAGGAAGAGLLKAGTALLASGAIASGAGGLLTRTDHQRAVRDQHGSARSQQSSDAASTDREVAAAPVRPAVPEHHLETLRASRTPAGAEGDGSGGERRGSRHSSGDEGDDGPGGERPAGRDDAKARHGGDDHESEPEQTREASNERPDEHSAEDSHGDVRSGSPSGSEGSDSSAGSGPGTPDSASDAPAEE